MILIGSLELIIRSNTELYLYVYLCVCKINLSCNGTCICVSARLCLGVCVYELCMHVFLSSSSSYIMCLFLVDSGYVLL